MWRSALLLVGLGLLLPGSALGGNPYEELFGRKPHLWTDPDARFSIDLPVGWEAHHKEGQSYVMFTREDRDQGLSAQVTVEVRNLPPNTRLSHFALSVQEEAKKAARNFDVVDRDRVKISGQTADRTLFTYQVRGNAQLTREVVQVVLLVEERGYVITLETAYGVRARFWEEFELMLKGFSADAASPVNSRAPSGNRKKLRAGELVNPDALKY